ncbi:exodeoxyribonuclease V subunit alpha, partial [Vibrio parahaemolyticus]|nr:exodeoxyribonuclease V subunit alpha [Vibrio parahaemolyticus]
MTTNHNLHSGQDSLLVVLERLAHKGAIRQLDYQFACFIDSQTHDEQSDSQALAFIAGVVSNELGKGHICLSLFDAQGQSTDLASKLGLFGESALALNTQLQVIDWIELLQNSSLVGAQGEALPLMFDGERLYLHRYWHYEVTLAEKLNQLGAAVNLQPQEFARLSELLNHLFARQYHFLFNALGKAVEAGSSNQVLRQQLVCDHLDVVASESLDWHAIDSVLSNARKLQDLQTLDELVPHSACVNWQKVAAAVALTRRFAVISGGP